MLGMPIVEHPTQGKIYRVYPKAEVVGAGKLKSTDGVYGIRSAHNTDGIVTGLSLVK